MLHSDRQSGREKELELAAAVEGSANGSEHISQIVRAREFLYLKAKEHNLTIQLKKFNLRALHTA